MLFKREKNIREYLNIDGYKIFVFENRKTIYLVKSNIGTHRMDFILTEENNHILRCRL